MKFFVDTAEIDQIKELNDLGMVDGVTTNPSLIKNQEEISLKLQRKFAQLLRAL
jgi:transaldolase